MTPTPPGADTARFNALWKAYAGRVLAYAIRHVGPDDAQEIVSETFLVAWRRLVDVPGQPLPWLLVVARNTAANHRRSIYRGTIVHSELARLQRAAGEAVGADVTATERALALSRLAALSSTEREALLLVSWDGLKPAQAAQVAGCSVATFQVRLHRARRRLQHAAHADQDQPGTGAISPPAADRTEPTAQPCPPFASTTPRTL